MFTFPFLIFSAEKKGQSVLVDLRQSFYDVLDIHQEAILVDTRPRSGKQMTALRERFCELSKRITVNLMQGTCTSGDTSLCSLSGSAFVENTNLHHAVLDTRTKWKSMLMKYLSQHIDVEYPDLILLLYLEIVDCYTRQTVFHKHKAAPKRKRRQRGGQLVGAKDQLLNKKELLSRELKPKSGGTKVRFCCLSSEAPSSSSDIATDVYWSNAEVEVAERKTSSLVVSDKLVEESVQSVNDCLAEHQGGLGKTI